jgi:hypothetical protein
MMVLSVCLLLLSLFLLLRRMTTDDYGYPPQRMQSHGGEIEISIRLEHIHERVGAIPPTMEINEKFRRPLFFWFPQNNCGWIGFLLTSVVYTTLNSLVKKMQIKNSDISYSSMNKDLTILDQFYKKKYHDALRSFSDGDVARDRWCSFRRSPRDVAGIIKTILHY